MPGETSRLISRSSERLVATGRALWHDPKSEPYRLPLVALSVSLAFSLLLHALLPDWEAFRGFGAILMGPIPASFGLAIGLYIHRASPRWLLWLGGAAWAFLVEMACLVVLGTLILGPWAALKGIYFTISVGLFEPFSAFGYLTDRFLAVPAIWSILKVVITWAAFVYAGVMVWRYDGLGLVVPLLSRYGNNRAFAREQRRVRQVWQREYLEATRAGLPPPPPPPELTVAGGARHFGQHLHALFWVIRIGAFVIGGLSFWALFSDQLKAIIRQIGYGIFMRGLFGG